jgi:hypothetical protein
MDDSDSDSSSILSSISSNGTQFEQNVYTFENCPHIETSDHERVTGDVSDSVGMITAPRAKIKKMEKTSQSQ